MSTREHTSRHRPSSIALMAGAAITVSLAACTGAEVLDRRAAVSSDPVVIVQAAARGSSALAVTSTATRTRADGSVPTATSRLVVARRAA